MFHFCLASERMPFFMQYVVYFALTLNGVAFTTLFFFNLFSFGIIMLTLGILGEYLWRTFHTSRNRPPYIVEDGKEEDSK